MARTRDRKHLDGNKEAIHVDGGTEIIQQNNHMNYD
jgi:hypothetical protein